MMRYQLLVLALAIVCLSCREVNVDQINAHMWFYDYEYNGYQIEGSGDYVEFGDSTNARTYYIKGTKIYYKHQVVAIIEEYDDITRTLTITSVNGKERGKYRRDDQYQVPY